MIEERCGSCNWFKKEPSTQINPRSIAAISARREGLSSSLSGGSTRPVYGKCQAQFADANGQLQRFDMGMISTQSCRAKDDQGNVLFTAKVNQ